MTIYARLPEDLQNKVARYLPLWQRLGLSTPPKVKDPIDRYTYYDSIRRFPKQLIRSRYRGEFPRVLYYRRQSYHFQWEYFMYDDNYYCEQWIVRAYPQWKKQKSSFVPNHLYCPPPLWCSIVQVIRSSALLHMYVEIVRPTFTSPPTRQAVLREMTTYVRRLAYQAERLGKNGQ